MPELICNLCDEPFASSEVLSAWVRSNVRAFREEKFCIWRCGGCGSMHSRDRLDLALYYAAYPFHQQQRRDVISWLLLDNLLNRLKRAGLRKEHKILDYGCGSGALLAHLISRGYRDVTGYDAHSTLYEDTSVLEKRYDCVISQDVIEHVAEPRALLRSLDGLVRPGGLVSIGTPDAARLDLRRPEDFVHALHQPYHTHILSKDALLKACRALGWSLERFYDRPYVDTVFPGLNGGFYRYYSRCFDDCMDLFFEGVPFHRRLLLPKSIFLFFFGYLLSPKTDLMAIFRT
jgi:2-polyprenyl-3-methyl-5-hydroxy-6-metoxy-1,4-benzoquinol methylase